MGNTLLTPSIIAKEALMVLENNLVMASKVYRDYDPEYQKVGATITIRKPATFEATAFSTTIIVQDATESSVQVVLDKHMDVSFSVTSKDMALNIVDFSRQFIEPALRAHAQSVDYALTGLHADVAGHYPVSATQVVGDIANIGAQLNIQKVPFGDRSGVMDSITYARYIALDAFSHASKRGDGGKTLREAEIGRVLGIDWYQDQNIRTAAAGLTDTAGAVAGAVTAGATAATVNALTDSQVLEDNALFKVAGDDFGYRVTNGPVTVASTAAVITFTPACKNGWDDTKVVTFQTGGRRNMVFHKNAFCLATAPLAAPTGGAESAVENYKGLTLRVVKQYDITYKKDVISIDMLYGTKTLDADLAAILVDAN